MKNTRFFIPNLNPNKENRLYLFGKNLIKIILAEFFH